MVVDELKIMEFDMSINSLNEDEDGDGKHFVLPTDLDTVLG